MELSAKRSSNILLYFMAKGISLHIGLNGINPIHYGTEGRLTGAIYDAEYMFTLAKNAGFQRTQLCCKPENATCNVIVKAIQMASEDLYKGDTFFISYSGHGGRLPNMNDDIEIGGEDQTWCLYDRQLPDDELRTYWKKFREGVKILVITDSCFSGSIVKGRTVNMGRSIGTQEFYTKKVLESSTIDKIYQNNKAQYDAILKQEYVKESDIKAGILLISSSKDSELSYDTRYNGVFTKAFRKAFENNHHESYQTLFSDIKTAGQTTILLNGGNTAYHFYKQKPFNLT
jgi:hypothetical protein